jgi:hypothetical protein
MSAEDEPTEAPPERTRRQAIPVPEEKTKEHQTEERKEEHEQGQDAPKIHQPSPVSGSFWDAIVDKAVNAAEAKLAPRLSATEPSSTRGRKRATGIADSTTILFEAVAEICAYASPSAYDSEGKIAKLLAEKANQIAASANLGLEFDVTSGNVRAAAKAAFRGLRNGAAG